MKLEDWDDCPWPHTDAQIDMMSTGHRGDTWKNGYHYHHYKPASRTLLWTSIVILYVAVLLVAWADRRTRATPCGCAHQWMIQGEINQVHSQGFARFDRFEWATSVFADAVTSSTLLNHRWIELVEDVHDARLDALEMPVRYKQDGLLFEDFVELPPPGMLKHEASPDLLDGEPYDMPHPDDPEFWAFEGKYTELESLEVSE